jgi:Ca2+-binding RTX toxin-like protein
MGETSPPNPNVIVITQAGESIDLSGVSDTTVVALGAVDQIDLYGDNYEDGEGSGDTVVATGYKSDVIIGTSEGLGANDIQLNGYDEALTESPYADGSNDTIDVNGKDASVDIGGYNSVVLNGTDNVVTTDPDLRADSYDPFGDNNVVANGAGKETVTGGGQAFTFTGGDGRYLINGGGAEDTTISGGAGGGVFIGGYFYRSDYLSFPDYIGRNVITAGLQASTLIGSAHGSSLLIANGSARDVLIAGEYGNDTLSGGTSTGNNTYEGYDGPYVPSDDPTIPSLVVEAGSGNDLLIGGLAAETLTGGTGHDLFRFLAHAAGPIPAGGDQTVITDFTPGLDKIDLRGFTVTSEQVVATETISQGSTHLSLPDGQKITLLHVTDLSAKDFTRS